MKILLPFLSHKQNKINYLANDKTVWQRGNLQEFCILGKTLAQLGNGFPGIRTPSSGKEDLFCFGENIIASGIHLPGIGHTTFPLKNLLSWVCRRQNRYRVLATYWHEGCKIIIFVLSQYPEQCALL